MKVTAKRVSSHVNANVIQMLTRIHTHTQIYAVIHICVEAIHFWTHVIRAGTIHITSSKHRHHQSCLSLCAADTMRYKLKIFIESSKLADVSSRTSRTKKIIFHENSETFLSPQHSAYGC